MTFNAQILTLFPDMFPATLGQSLAGKALTDGKSRLCYFILRDNPDVPPDEEGMICGGEMEVMIEVW